MRWKPKLWDSQRERERRKKKKERENFPVKSSNLRHCQAHSQNKGLSKHQRRGSWMQTGPCTAGSKESGRQQPEPEGEGVISMPETASSTKLRAGSQLLTKSSWDPGWLTSARRVAARDQLSRGDREI